MFMVNLRNYLAVNIDNFGTWFSRSRHLRSMRVSGFCGSVEKVSVLLDVMHNIPGEQITYLQNMLYFMLLSFQTNFG